MDKKSFSKPKKKRKFRIVLDSAFAKPSFFPKLKKKAKLYHCVYDFGLSRQAEDEQIYHKASEKDCFVLTVNFDDFKKLVNKNKSGILGIESQLTTATMDSTIAAFLSGKDPDEYKGKAIKLSANMEDKKKGY